MIKIIYTCDKCGKECQDTRAGTPKATLENHTIERDFRLFDVDATWKMACKSCATELEIEHDLIARKFWYP
jgi:DNA-directed RNA polymerase subunit RPC12/RpoP